MEFKDINFKLSVISALHNLGHYNAEAEAMYEQYGNEDDFSYEPIHEVYAFYRDLEPDQEKLDEVTGIYPDGGDECYMYVINNWDGEDDTFDITSIEGIGRLRNLEVFDPVSMIANEGIDLAPLLECSRLRLADAGCMKDTEENREVVRKLRERGVEVTGVPG